MFIDPLYTMKCVDNYLFTFYQCLGGGDVVIIQTTEGLYITGDMIHEDMDDATYALLSNCKRQ